MHITFTSDQEVIDAECRSTNCASLRHPYTQSQLEICTRLATQEAVPSCSSQSGCRALTCLMHGRGQCPLPDTAHVIRMQVVQLFLLQTESLSTSFHSKFNSDTYYEVAAVSKVISNPMQNPGFVNRCIYHKHINCDLYMMLTIRPRFLTIKLSMIPTLQPISWNASEVYVDIPNASTVNPRTFLHALQQSAVTERCGELLYSINVTRYCAGHVASIHLLTR